MEEYYDLKTLMEHVNDLIEVCPSSIKQEPREELEAFARHCLAQVLQNLLISDNFEDYVSRMILREFNITNYKLYPQNVRYIRGLVLKGLSRIVWNLAMEDKLNGEEEG